MVLECPQVVLTSSQRVSQEVPGGTRELKGGSNGTSMAPRPTRLRAATAANSVQRQPAAGVPCIWEGRKP